MKKFSIKNYGSPTPSKWRKLGDSLLATSAFAMTYAAITDHKYLAVGIVVVGIVGKFLTNFFSKDDSGSENNTEENSH
jgi:hypothetical protein